MSATSSCTDPGYLTTLSLDGSQYNVFAYIQEADGSKRFLPADNLQSLEKIRNLATGLLEAHEARRIERKEPKYNYTLATLDSRGLIIKPDSIVSHDFFIQPVESTVANRMATALSSPEQRMEASAVKAQDVWTSLEGMIRSEIGPPPATMPPPGNRAATAPATNTNPVVPTTPVTNPVAPANVPAPPSTATIPTPPPQPSAASTPQTHQAPIRPEWTWQGFDFQQPNWYDGVPDQIKLRIVSDILTRRSPAGGVYGEVWKLFRPRANNNDAVLMDLLDEERRQLSICCNDKALRSPIPLKIRDNAEALIDSYYKVIRESDLEDLEEKIVDLMTKEFVHKERLFQCIREQGIAERVVIESRDREWAENCYFKNPHLFVRALIRWLDNN